MSTVELVVGFVFLAVTYGGAGWAAWVLTDRLTGTTGALRVLAWGLLTTGVLLLVHILPGAVGVLGREVVAGLAVLAAVVAHLVVPRREGVVPDRTGDEGDDEPLGPIGWIGMATGAVWLTIVSWQQRFLGPAGYDAASAYLPAAARWLRTGSMWGFGDWVPGLFFGSSPGNGSVVLLSALLPWRHDFLARYAIHPFLVLLVLAVYCLARQLAAPRSVAVLLGLAVTAAPVVVEPVVRSALLDPVLYAGYAGGLAFLVRHWRRNDPADLLVAGVGLGIAFGTKFYAFLAVPLAWAVWVLARLLRRDPVRRVLAHALAVVAAVAVVGGFWVLRNAVETGNPAYPVAIDVLGLDAPPDPLLPLVGSSLVDYLDDPSAWTGELAHQFRIAIGLPLVVIGVGWVAGAVLLLWRRGDARRGPAAAGVVLGAVVGVAYLATPYTGMGPPGQPIIAAANVRYGIPALLVAAAVAGWASRPLPGWARRVAELALLVAMLDALRVGVSTTADRAAVALAVGVPLGTVVWWLLQRRPATATGGTRPAAARAALLGAGAVVLLGAVAVGRWLVVRYDAVRFRTGDPAVAWVLDATDTTGAGDDGVVIGLVGTWTDRGVAPIYPAFGDRLQNEVVYLGDRTDGLLVPYATAGDLEAAIEREGVDILVVGLAESYIPFEDLGPDELQAVASSAGFRPVASSDRLLVLQRDGAA